MPHEVDRVADQVRRAAEGHAWSGPSAREALGGVTATMATAHPISGAHSIWELVRHMTVWAHAARRRLAGEIVEPTPEEDYPPTDGLRSADWDRDCRALYAAHEALATAIAALDDSALDRIQSSLARDHYKFSTLILEIVMSNAFQMRKEAGGPIASR